MEFNRLADVEVVETANDTDKVLIEQGGEIKRVPKTEVGGSGGKMLIVNCVFNPETNEITDTASNMTLDETIEAIDNHELTGAIAYITARGVVVLDMLLIVNETLMLGKPCISLYAIGSD